MTIFGWDLSHYDDPTIGDAVREGFSFFTHKAGGDADDSEIGTWWQGVKGIPPEQALLGAYWVLYPGSAVAKADRFLARLDATCGGWRNRPFILQVDCEEWNGNSDTVPSKADIKAFCDRLAEKMPKLKPIVYAPEWVYGDKLAGLNYPLWASRYVGGSGTAYSLYPGDSSSKWDAYSGQTPAILQFTSSATIAGQTTCDANAFRGTLAELSKLVAPGWEVEMANTPLTADEIKGIWSVDGLIANAPGAGDIATNAEIAPKTALQRIYDLEQRNFNADLPGAIAALASQVTALTALVSALAAPTVPGFTAEQLEEIIKQALREGTGA